MKTTLAIALTALSLAGGRATVRAAEGLSETLQKGLFEEEANHDLAAAIKAYQTVVQRADEQRKLTATAIFRLGECYRKLGQTNEAAGQYERILREFPEQDQLTGLSQQNLFVLGVKPASGASAAVRAVSDPEQVRLLEDEIKLVESQVKQAEARQANGAGSTTEVLQARRALLPLKRQLPANATSAAQAGLIEQQIKLVEELRQSVEAMVKVGQAAPLDAIPVRREIFSLKRELAALSVSAAKGSVSTEARGATDEEEKEVQRIKALTKDSPDLINSVGAGANGQWTPLHQAAANGQLLVARFLLANKADVNARAGGDSATPLTLAASRGHKSMVELLIANGADISLSGMSGTALHLAAFWGFKSVAEVLMMNKADVNARNSEGRTPLHLAAREGRQAVVELLLTKGADINARDTSNRTPLQMSVENNQPTTVNLLLSNKAGVNEGNSDIPPLYLAVRNKNLMIATSLLKSGADVNAKLGSGNSLLRSALDVGSVEMVKLLLSYKPSLEVLDLNGLTLLQAAIYNDSGSRTVGAEIVESLLSSGANVNAPFKPTGGAEWLERNLHQDPIVDNTPLIVAIRKGRADLVDALLAHGADVNAKAPDGRTALHYAVQKNSLPIVQGILARHPDTEIRDDNGQTPLLLAWNINIMEALIRAGANVNAPFPSGVTALRQAVIDHRKDQVELLVTNKADVNVMDHDGNTPLVLAQREARASNNPASVRAMQGDIAKFLLAHGADENIHRRSSISATRGERKLMALVFFKGTNAFNRYTLLELVTALYGDGMRTDYQFPDFANVKIKRLANADANEDISVDVDKILRSGDCSQDLGLQWGDLVEIPETDHGVSEPWRGLPKETMEFIQKCLKREVEITVKGEHTRKTLLTSFRGSPYGPLFGAGSPIPMSRPMIPGVPGRPASGFNYTSAPPPVTPDPWRDIMLFRLKDVLSQANLVRLSSDLSRVKVTRPDPKLGPREFIFDLSEGAPYDGRTDLWLRDGDVIEVPEK